MRIICALVVCSRYFIKKDSGMAWVDRLYRAISSFFIILIYPGGLPISAASTRIIWLGFSFLMRLVKFSGTVPPSKTNTSSLFSNKLPSFLAKNEPRKSSPRNWFPMPKITSLSASLRNFFSFDSNGI